MRSNKTKSGTFLITLGVLLLIASVSLSTYNLYESRKAKESAALVVDSLVAEIEEKIKEKAEETETSDTFVETVADYVEYPEMEMPTVTINGEQYIGYLEIPGLDLVLPVTAGKWSDEKMKTAPCLYTGSVYKNNIVIAGHNYPGHFGRINALPAGTEIQFTDAAGNQFKYTVGWTETVDGTDIEGMTEEGGWDMTLFTCNYSGDKRIAVRCILNS